MRSDYKRLGEFIRLVDERNSDLAITNLQGVSITKEFVPSIANIIGTDLSTYKIVRKGQFAYGPVTSRNGDKISIALLKDKDCIISSSYVPFEVYKPEELLPEYLMLWFMRSEFDRYARFMSNGSAREVFDWECMCGVEIPVPTISEQCRIVWNYNVINNRIKLLHLENNKLNELMQSIYRNSFSNNSVVPTVEAKLADLCLDIQRGFTPVYTASSNIFDLNQKVNKGIFLDKQFFAFIDENAIIPKDKYARKKDILMNYLGDGTLGRVHYYNEDTTNVVVNQFIIIIRTNTEVLLPEYLYSVLSSPDYQHIILSNVSGSTGMLVLNISTIRDFKIPVPSLSSQKEYAQIAEKIWNSITNNYSEISVLEKLSQCLISGINQ